MATKAATHFKAATENDKCTATEYEMLHHGRNRLRGTIVYTHTHINTYMHTHIHTYLPHVSSFDGRHEERKQEGKKVRLGIQAFPVQRVIATTLPTCLRHSSSQTLKQRFYTKEGPFKVKGLPNATRYSCNAANMPSFLVPRATRIYKRRSV